MKYKPEDYINSGFYSYNDEEIEITSVKIVKCRKPHKCMGGCDTEIQAGEHAMCEKGFLDGQPVSCYTCLPCIESWMEESGQFEPDEEEVNENENI